MTLEIIQAIKRWGIGIGLGLLLGFLIASFVLPLLSLPAKVADLEKKQTTMDTTLGAVVNFLNQATKQSAQTPDLTPKP